MDIAILMIRVTLKMLGMLVVYGFMGLMGLATIYWIGLAVGSFIRRKFYE